MKYVLLVAALLLTGCTNSPQEIASEAQQKIVYFQDANTSLCFATTSSSTYGGRRVSSIANVPCTDLVKQNLVDSSESD